MSVKRSDQAMGRAVGDEFVILDVATGEYFGLNVVGGLIWACLEADTTIDDLIDTVTEAYDVERSMAEADVRSLIDDLIEAGLVIE